MIRVLIRKRPDRGDLILYYVHPDTHREVSKTAGTTDKGEAERAASRWETELNEFFGAGNDGWQHFRDRFRREHLEAVSSKAMASFATALNRFETLMQPASLASIDATTISLYNAKLLGEAISPATVGNYLTHLRAALNWAEGVGMMRKAPKVKMPKQHSRVFMKGRPLTEDEYKSMREACRLYPQSPAWQRMLDLLWHSGLRLSEAMLLSWDEPPLQVELDSKPYPQILFYAAGHKARRDEAIPITPEFARWLSETPAKQRTGLVAPLPIATMPRVSEQITEIGRAANVFVTATKPASAHDFRRAFGTRLAPKVMPATLQKIMRHAELSTTMRFYVNLSAADAGRELWGAPTNAPKANNNRRPAGGRKRKKTAKKRTSRRRN